jgi:hypothetical protein
MLVKTLPPPFSEAPPIIANNPPNIQIPYLNNDNFSGLSGPKIEKLLQPMVINNPRTPGFTINKSFAQNLPIRVLWTPINYWIWSCRSAVRPYRCKMQPRHWTQLWK